MFCSKCGEKIDENSKFCDKCGAKVGGNGINLDKVGDKVKEIKNKIPTDKIPLDKIPKDKKPYIIGGAVVAAVVLVIVFIVMLSGGKKLKCYMTFGDNRIDIETVFKHDEINSMKVIMTYGISDLDDDDIDDIYDEAKDNKKEYKDAGLKVKLNKNSKYIKMEVSGSSKHLDDFAKELDMEEEDLDVSYDEVKKEFKKIGLTCK